MSEPAGPIETPIAERREDFRRRTLPVVVWAVAALACVALLVGRVQRYEHVGIAQALEFEISTGADGRVASIEVQPFEEVEAGEVVARLDDAAVVAALETARARVLQLESQLEAGRVQANSASAGFVADLRRFQIDEERQRLDVLGLRVAIEGGTVETQRLALDLARIEPLFQAGVASREDYDNARLLHDQAQRQLDQSREQLAGTEREQALARSRREEYEAGLPAATRESALVEPLRAAITVEERAIDEIEVRRRATVLRSPVAGQVTQVLCRAGQGVVAGERILTVVEAVPREIVAWLAESDPAPTPSGTRVLVWSRSQPRRAVESVVVRDSRAVQALPPRLWRDPRVTDYGRGVVIAAVPGLDLAPGELVGVRIVGR